MHDYCYHATCSKPHLGSILAFLDATHQVDHGNGLTFSVFSFLDILVEHSAEQQGTELEGRRGKRLLLLKPRNERRTAPFRSVYWNGQRSAQPFKSNLSQCTGTYIVRRTKTIENEHL